MAAALWPSTLPQCPSMPLSETPQPNVVSFKPEVGPPKKRRRSTAKGVLTECTFRMNNSQVLTFDTFYSTTLADGSLPFQWAHPRTKVNYNWMFSPGDEPQTQRFGPNASTVQVRLVRLP